MWVYYQTVESGLQKWQLTSSDQCEAVRKERAYHMGIYWLDKLPEATEPTDIRYKGDFWFDIDHKPKVENPTQQQKDEAIQLAIVDTNKILEYLKDISIDLNICKIYASGSKGFHICIPGKVIGAGNAYKGLPKMHKEIAQRIREYTGITGMDDSLYACGKGKMLRVANKQRANGNYKVPVTHSEVSLMTPEMYWKLVAEPRPEIEYPIPKGMINQELAILFDEAREAIKITLKATFDSVVSEQLEPFIDNPPTCISWITQNVNMEARDGGFNKAKMSLSRYLMTAPISDDAKNELMFKFAENWENTRFSTVEARVREVRSSSNYGRENGFSCDAIANGFTESPCKGCPIKENQRVAHSEVSGIEEGIDGYYRPAAKGRGAKITNFTLKPIRKYTDKDDSAMFTAYDYEVYESRTGDDPEVTCILNLDFKAWNSASEFKKQISNRGVLNYVGSDTDLQHLKAYLTSPAMDTGVKIVKTINTIGIFRHIDKARDIDEYVWVEPNWSVNPSKVSDTVKCGAHKRQLNGDENNITVPMREVATLDPANADFNVAYKALLNTNNKVVVASIVGWMTSCWLKLHIMRGSDRHFPLLHLHGSSGSGKTETATLFTLLAGADYFNGRPLVVSGATPYAIVSEATLTTTVPRIFDELNAHKIGQKGRYAAAREALKAASTGGCMPQGSLGPSGVHLEERPVSSPLIALATQENTESEIQQRAICVHINSLDRDNGENTDNFLVAREQAMDLWPLAKALMTEALSTDPDWVQQKMKDNRKSIPKVIDHRPTKNWQVVLTGIDFLVETLTKHSVATALVEETRELKNHILESLESNKHELAQKSLKQEVDNVIDTIGEIATVIDSQGDTKLKSGLHYVVQGTTLHIFATACFVIYVRYMKDNGKIPELSEIKNFRTLLSSQPYFLKGVVTPGVKFPNDWYSFSLPELAKRGVSIERFTAE